MKSWGKDKDSQFSCQLSINLVYPYLQTKIRIGRTFKAKGRREQSQILIQKQNAISQRLFKFVSRGG